MHLPGPSPNLPLRPGPLSTFSALGLVRGHYGHATVCMQTRVTRRGVPDAKSVSRGRNAGGRRLTFGEAEHNVHPRATTLAVAHHQRATRCGSHPADYVQAQPRRTVAAIAPRHTV